MEESPSDSVNDVNADVPLDNDGGEKVVGALLVMDCFEPILEKRQSQIVVVAQRIIAPFPFGHNQHDYAYDDHQSQGKGKGNRRKKRDIRITALKTAIFGTVLLICDVAVALLTFISYKQNKQLHNSTMYHSKTGVTAFVLISICIVVFYIRAFMLYKLG